MEENDFVTKYIKNTESLTRVTRVSRYLAVVIFVSLPFIGAFIGYQHAPVSYTDNLVVIKVQDKAGKAELEEFKKFSCDHRHLHEDYVSIPAEWLEYYNEKFDFGFSYPPERAPNYEEEYEDGTLRMGYNPVLDPKMVDKYTSGKMPIESGWNVHVYRATTTYLFEGGPVEPDKPETYCEDTAWCLKDQISIESSDLAGYVVSVEEHSVANPASRTYYLDRKDLRFILYSEGDQSNYIEGYPCSYIVGVNDIDRIAQSLY